MELLIGVTAGIAAYKTAALVSRLVRQGHGVSVIMTPEATHLVGPRTFQALTGRPVLVEMFAEGASPIPHIEQARKADLLCVAPATANILGKAANGIADDLLSTTLLAFDGPVLFAPAMNGVMWKNPAVQRNVAQLQNDGYHFVGPVDGPLACGESMPGRMAEPETLASTIEALLQANSR
ncbi:MAG: flavoprotein [Planctomycetia bacterium]|nr:flavoprotein [Planctomycetia bacterium]